MTYVDNAMNRALGRVGKPYGSHVLHSDGSVTIDFCNYKPGTAPVQCDANKASLGYVSGYYVDNSRLGRVGQPYGTHLLHPTNCIHIKPPPRSASQGISLGGYVDNSLNRHLGRVGKPYGTHVLHNDGTQSVSSTTGHVDMSKPEPHHVVDRDAIHIEDKHVGADMGMPKHDKAVLDVNVQLSDDHIARKQLTASTIGDPSIKSPVDNTDNGNGPCHTLPKKVCIINYYNSVYCSCRLIIPTRLYMHIILMVGL